MTKYEHSIACLIIGILVILGGGVFSSWFFYTYRDWVEVEYSAQDLSCNFVKRSKGSPSKVCTVEYHYTYNGQSYSVVSNYENPTNGQNGTFYINPQDPEKHFTMFDGYVGLSIIGVGFLLLLFSGLLRVLDNRKKGLEG